MDGFGGVDLRHAAMGLEDRDNGAELVGALDVVLNIGLAISLGVVDLVGVVWGCLGLLASLGWLGWSIWVCEHGVF